ncbi:PTS system fructose-specific EIIABC component [bioreactor metagenome]|uniref:PTS system fructose-specific EIIABC component n=1 Tax=bioreactor metagenome TaxID=1076179 RepID=A0A645H732_9ZZZZ
MKANELLKLESIKIGLVVKNKKEALNRMVELAAKSEGKIKNINTVKEQVFEREKLASTGIGNRVAIPHTKSNNVQSIVASCAILKTPIEFDAIDNKPVQIIFMLLSQESNVGRQLRYLSSYSKILSKQENIDKLLKFKYETEILDFFTSIED